MAYATASAMTGEREIDFRALQEQREDVVGQRANAVGPSTSRTFARRPGGRWPKDETASHAENSANVSNVIRRKNDDRAVVAPSARLHANLDRKNHLVNREDPHHQSCPDVIVPAETSSSPDKSVATPS